LLELYDSIVSKIILFYYSLVVVVGARVGGIVVVAVGLVLVVVVIGVGVVVAVGLLLVVRPLTTNSYTSSRINNKQKK